MHGGKGLSAFTSWMRREAKPSERLHHGRLQQRTLAEGASAPEDESWRMLLPSLHHSSSVSSRSLLLRPHAGWAAVAAADALGLSLSLSWALFHLWDVRFSPLFHALMPLVLLLLLCVVTKAPLVDSFDHIFYSRAGEPTHGPLGGLLGAVTSADL